MFEVTISGDIIPATGDFREYGFATIDSLENQLKEANGSDVIVNIDSRGGDVDTGFMMFLALRRYKDEYNANITTKIKGRCASIATVPFLAGDSRIANSYISPFVHNAWTNAVGDVEEMRLKAEALEAANDRIANHYASITTLSKDEALEYMSKNTYISVDDMLAIRFATEIEQVSMPLAMELSGRHIFNKQKRTMDQKEVQELLNAQKRENDSILKKIMNKLGLEDKPKNKEVQDVNGVVLNFPDVELDQDIAVGNRVTGEANPNGVYLLDKNTKITLKNGVVESIDELSSNTESKDEIANLKAELAQEKDKNVSELNNLKSEFEAFKSDSEARIQALSGSNGGRFNPNLDKSGKGLENSKIDPFSLNNAGL